MTTHRSLDDADYEKLRTSLLKKKGSSKQRTMLEAARSNNRFLKWFRDEVTTEGTREVRIINEKITEHQYKEPTKDTERDMYLAWRDLPPETTCRVTFWGEVTLCHIETNCIESSYLAANGGSLSSGLARIDKALSSGNSKEIDGCVRTMLRRMSGLPEARGNRSVYVNCPFGRAWWREHLTREICEITGAPRDGVLGVFRINQQYWEEIVTLIVSRNSVLGDRNVRDVLVWVLTELWQSDPEHALFGPMTLRKLCRLLGIRCAWQEMGLLEIEELREIIKQEIAAMQPSSANRLPRNEVPS